MILYGRSHFLSNDVECRWRCFYLRVSDRPKKPKGSGVSGVDLSNEKRYMTYRTLRRSELSPGLILSRDVMQVWYHGFQNCESGTLDRLRRHDHHRYNPFLRRTSKTTRGHLLVLYPETLRPHSGRLLSRTV